MANRIIKTDYIISYLGIDGACAAAAALLHVPDARVLVTSANRIGETLANLSQADENSGEIHVCGVGVWCDFEIVRDAATRLRASGARLVWHCGRGYLDAQRVALAHFCETAFFASESNTAAVIQQLDLSNHSRAEALAQLALHDPKLRSDSLVSDLDTAFWLDLLQALVGKYLKFEDATPYAALIEKLATNTTTKTDEAVVQFHRQAGHKYALRGKTSAMRTLKKHLHRAALADVNTLIAGESGVGKEVVAHLLHEGGARAMGPFRAVNCALFAGNSGLANSQLFGHLKGAFTGAGQDRAGAFVAADRGILFLDELGTLPPEVQAKLLRVIEDGVITPEGSDTEAHTVDVRVIAATNDDLPERIRAGEFRADLFHRLSALRITIPPLRERLDDITEILHGPLADLIQEGYGRRFSKRELLCLRDYAWPGNVRQLIKVVKSAAYLDIPLAEALAAEQALGDLSVGSTTLNEGEWLPQNSEDVEPVGAVLRRYAARALLLHAGNQAATARALGISKNTLKRYLER